MLDLVSKVRLGVDLDIIDETKPELLNILLIASQKNYIQNLQQNENMTPQEIDFKLEEGFYYARTLYSICYKSLEISSI